MSEELHDRPIPEQLGEEFTLFCRDVDSVLTADESFEHLDGGNYRLGTVEMEGDSGKTIGRVVVNKRGEERLVSITGLRGDTEVIFYTPAHDPSVWNEEGLSRIRRVRSLLARAQFGGIALDYSNDAQGRS